MELENHRALCILVSLLRGGKLKDFVGNQLRGVYFDLVGLPF